jgi:hypothetical protein
MCLCIVSKYPLYRTFEEMLQKLGTQSAHFLRYPLETYLSFLTSAIPAVPRGFFKLSVQLFDQERIEIVPPPLNDLPLSDLNFYPLAKHLSAENIVTLLNWIVLERDVLFVSNHTELLTPIAEGLMTLLFPFKFEYVYMPLLPQRYLDLVQANVPYVLGIHRSLYERAERLINQQTCVVDLDHDRVSETLIPQLLYPGKAWLRSGPKMGKSVAEIAPLPEHEKGKLLSRLRKPLYVFLHAPCRIKLAAQAIAPSCHVKEEHDALVHEIRNAALLFFVSTLKWCGDYLETKDGETRINKRSLVENVPTDYK